MDLPFARYLAYVFRFFIVTACMFTFSLKYVENERLLLLQPQMHVAL